MTKGPIEELGQRLAAIEQRAGLVPVVREERRPREGRLGPGGRWLYERLRAGHPERLDRSEEDLLGNAIVQADKGNTAEAQRLLDLLAEHHSIRLEFERAKLAGNGVDDETSD